MPNLADASIPLRPVSSSVAANRALEIGLGLGLAIRNPGEGWSFFFLYVALPGYPKKLPGIVGATLGKSITAPGFADATNMRSRTGAQEPTLGSHLAWDYRNRIGAE